MATRQGTAEGKTGEVKKSGRGFAGMDPALQREIARQGGRAAHEKGVAHQFTSQEARAAGRIGGQHSHGRRKARQQEEAARGVTSQEAGPGEDVRERDGNLGREREAGSVESPSDEGEPDSMRQN